jgi:hypothetical protein
MDWNVFENYELDPNQTPQTARLVDGRWRLARPLGVTLGMRLRAAWLVLKNEAAAVRWY